MKFVVKTLQKIDHLMGIKTSLTALDFSVFQIMAASMQLDYFCLAGTLFVFVHQMKQHTRKVTGLKLSLVMYANVSTFLAVSVSI